MHRPTITTMAIAWLLTIASAAPAATRVVPRIRASTGAPANVLETSALLTGSILAKNEHVSYYFRWGPTKALASQTKVVVDPKPEQVTPLRVGQFITGLQPGTVYYYKLVVVLPEGTKVEENEKFLLTKSVKLRFVIPHIAHVTYGEPFLLTGSFTGTGNAGVDIVMQASPFPYLEAFTPIGPPALTTRSGTFSFRVGNLKRSTQLRLVAQTPLPVVSPTVNVLVQPRVILHVRTSSQPGLDRFYGTISPAVHAGKVLIQVQKATRPHGPSESTVAWVGQFGTVVKKGAGGTSRFSVIVKVKRKGRYRVYLVLPKGPGPLTSGPSTSTIVLRGAA
jgi:hypothetical protein